MVRYDPEPGGMLTAQAPHHAPVKAGQHNRHVSFSLSGDGGRINLCSHYELTGMDGWCVGLAFADMKGHRAHPPFLRFPVSLSRISMQLKSHSVPVAGICISFSFVFHFSLTFYFHLHFTYPKFAFNFEVGRRSAPSGAALVVQKGDAPKLPSSYFILSIPTTKSPTRRPTPPAPRPSLPSSKPWSPFS